MFVIIGVLLGTTFAAMAKTKLLVVFFTLVVFCLGTYLLINSNQQKISKNKFKLHFRIIFGLISGFISAPMGIGGAVMNVP
ncbi:TSUP family transporter, partial [Neptunomonas phycophila]|uniref:TSUP family transporter n=1 Tax=Neptunomonas phycophila TaxID=1572645 RepID=UPI003C6DF6B5